MENIKGTIHFNSSMFAKTEQGKLIDSSEDGFSIEIDGEHIKIHIGTYSPNFRMLEEYFYTISNKFKQIQLDGNS